MIYGKKVLPPANSITLQPDQWVDKYAVRFYNYALSKVNDPELSRDLVQETFLTALEQRHTFEQRSSERSGLTGILKIKIYNIYKQRVKNTIFLADFRKRKAMFYLKAAPSGYLL